MKARSNIYYKRIEASLMGSFFFSQRSQRIYTKQRVIGVTILSSLLEIFLIMILNQKGTGAIIEDFFDYSSFGIFIRKFREVFIR